MKTNHPIKFKNHELKMNGPIQSLYKTPNIKKIFFFYRKKI
jgi:hypothetical protein